MRVDLASASEYDNLKLNLKGTMGIASLGCRHSGEIGGTARGAAGSRGEPGDHAAVSCGFSVAAAGAGSRRAAP